MRIHRAGSKPIDSVKKSSTREDGFTLMEILIALSIFAVGILAVASMQIRSMQVNSMASNVTESTTWAQDRMEELITLSWTHSDLSSGPHGPETTPDGTVITWTVTDVILGGAAAANFKRIRMQSTYNDGLGNTKTININGAYPLVAVP